MLLLLVSLFLIKVLDTSKLKCSGLEVSICLHKTLNRGGYKQFSSASFICSMVGYISQYLKSTKEI